jgi:hypothetical protein
MLDDTRTNLMKYGVPTMMTATVMSALIVVAMRRNTRLTAKVVQRSKQMTKDEILKKLKMK